MKNLVTKAVIFFSLFMITCAYAEPSIDSSRPKDRTFILRIKADQAGIVAPLYGSYMEMNQDQSKRITDLSNKVTPIEITANTSVLSTMVMSSEMITLEVFEKEGKTEKFLFSGTGRGIVGITDVSGEVRSVYARK